MQANLKIEGMHCQGCVRAVRSVLGKVDGVIDVSIDLDRGHAHVRSDAPLSPETLAAAVEKAGYTATIL